MRVDALGNPINFLITEGQRHDAPMAFDLVRPKPHPRRLLADKGYDSDPLRQYVALHGTEAIIPHRNKGKRRPEVDRFLYRERKHVEHTFARLKHYRRFATRFEKNIQSYAAMVALACAMMWV